MQLRRIISFHEDDRKNVQVFYNNIHSLMKELPPTISFLREMIKRSDKQMEMLVEAILNHYIPARVDEVQVKMNSLFRPGRHVVITFVKDHCGKEIEDICHDEQGEREELTINTGREEPWYMMLSRLRNDPALPDQWPM